jgi:hypothetical protein
MKNIHLFPVAFFATLGFAATGAAQTQPEIQCRNVQGTVTDIRHNLQPGETLVKSPDGQYQACHDVTTRTSPAAPAPASSLVPVAPVPQTAPTTTVVPVAAAAPVVAAPTPVLTPRTQEASAPALPTAPGLYVLRNTYQALLPAPIESTQPKVGRAILNAYSLGLAGNRIVMIIPGETSPVHLTARPSFVLVNTGPGVASSVQWGSLNPRALEIVKLDQKKNHREVNIVHGTSWNPSIGLPDPKWPFTITTMSESVYQLTLSQDLPPGEYMVLSGMMANGYNGFDFTVVRER